MESTPDRIIRLPEVIKMTGFKKVWLYTLMREGRFPKSRKIGQRSVGWSYHEVQAWVNDRLNSN